MSAREEQDKAGRNLRAANGNPRERAAYELIMQHQRDRIQGAREGLAAAEEAIAARYAEIAELTAKLADSDLAFL